MNAELQMLEEGWVSADVCRPLHPALALGCRERFQGFEIQSDITAWRRLSEAGGKVAES